MSPTEVRLLTDTQIVEMLVALRPSDEAVAWLASVVSNDAAFEGVRELRKRFTTSNEIDTPKTPTGRVGSARTVAISGDRWRAFLWRHRLAAVDVGSLMTPERCSGWASVVASRGRAGFYALDDLACALDMRVEDLIGQCGTDDERARLACCV